MDAVFKALADSTRREILDGLMAHEGQTLKSICQRTDMSRQGVAKHVGILENAGLVVIYARGREKLHYLNPVPIQQIAERWIDKYAQSNVAAMTALKSALENQENKHV
jgi:DNA-binding transcriptional ArsR family regulator